MGTGVRIEVAGLPAIVILKMFTFLNRRLLHGRSWKESRERPTGRWLSASSRRCCTRLERTGPASPLARRGSVSKTRMSGCGSGGGRFGSDSAVAVGGVSFGAPVALRARPAAGRDLPNRCLPTASSPRALRFGGLGAAEWDDGVQAPPAGQQLRPGAQVRKVLGRDRGTRSSTIAAHVLARA